MVLGFVARKRMETMTISNEEYAIDGDPWQSARPSDGMQRDLDP